MLDERTFKKISVIFLVAALLVLSLVLLWPIASAIITGLILSYIFYPAYKKVLSFVKEKNISALIVMLIVLLIIVLPLAFLFPYIIRQVFDIYLYTQNINIAEFAKKVFPSLFQASASKDIIISLNTFFSNLASKIFSSASSTIQELPNLGLKLAVILFVFFFGMRDAEIFKNYVASLSPFSKAVEEDLSKKFQDITNSVIYGYFVVGIIQGLFTGMGLFIAGIPNAVILTVLSMLASVIPVLGAWVIWIPSAIYLITSGKVIAGILLAIYGAFFIAWIDNILRIYLVSRKTKISSAIVLIGMIGGLVVFGILGFIIGPLILAYLLLILDAYRERKFPDIFFQEK